MLIRVLIEILIDIKTSGLDLVTVSLICLRSAVWGNFSLKKWTDIAFQTSAFLLVNVLILESMMFQTSNLLKPTDKSYRITVNS